LDNFDVRHEAKITSGLRSLAATHANCAKLVGKIKHERAKNAEAIVAKEQKLQQQFAR
jgi:hypothetical protein